MKLNFALKQAFRLNAWDLVFAVNILTRQRRQNRNINFTQKTDLYIILKIMLLNINCMIYTSVTLFELIHSSIC